MSEKTVAAISSPMGVGGIGVIRISGEEAINIADRCFRAFSGRKLTSLKGYTAAYGEITEENGVCIDDGVALVFRAPKSYTGENVVEISVHGGTEVLKQSLRRVLACGASPAAGGEFTKRAFLNGKMDLSKAESIMEIISAKNCAALKISQGAKGGNIDRAVNEICEDLLSLAASVSYYADYPDEENEGVNPENFKTLLLSAEEKLNRLLSTYDSGKAVREGIDCAIVGKPNVGKSTLMNLLSGSERSIVTDVAGTTRDVIETTVNLGEITLNLADTAGIHQTDDTVEKVGVDRAVTKLENSGVILALFDTSKPLDNDDKNLLKQIKDKRAVVIINKCDLETKLDTSVFADFNTVYISAKSGEGKDALLEEIIKVCRISHLSESDTVLISERQYDCVRRSLCSVTSAKDALLSGVTVDAVGVCIDDALSALLELTGKRVTNEVTDEIFRKFCVGK